MVPLSDVIESFKRCLKHERFYDIFLESLQTHVPASRDLFRDRDPEQLKAFFRKSVKLILMDAAGSAHARQALAEIRRKLGSEELDLDPAWFPFWTKSVLSTVRQCDAAMTADLEDEWRRVLMTGVGRVTP